MAGRPVTLVGSFPDPQHRLEPALPEFALIGRSNVGKSSLLNALTGRRALARVSQTPGKTQLINVYQLAECYLIDLPGYGFAKASHTDREAYRRLLERLLRVRTSLTGVIWLLDIRHPPSKEDRAFQDLLIATSRPVIAVLTKADKLSARERQQAIRRRAEEVGLPDDQVHAVSSHGGQGIAALAETLLHAAREYAV